MTANAYLTRSTRPAGGQRRAMAAQSRPVLFVCSGGGHLAQLQSLRPWWCTRQRAWVTCDNPHSRSLLEGEEVVWAHFPTTRSIVNLVRNTLLAIRLLVRRRRRPAAIISTGAGVALPFFIVGRLVRVPTVYIEVFDRIDMPTLTGRLCRPFSSLFLVQWDDQGRIYPGAAVVGPLL
jgi:UDP-N-acetylglucosamine:LPS N-acetylglucosamine transferase